MAPIPSQNLWEAFPLNCAFRRKAQGAWPTGCRACVADGAHAPLEEDAGASLPMEPERTAASGMRNVLERLKERVEVKKRRANSADRGKQGAAHFGGRTRHQNVSETMAAAASPARTCAGVLPLAPRDVAKLRPYEELSSCGSRSPGTRVRHHCCCCVVVVTRIAYGVALRKIEGLRLDNDEWPLSRPALLCHDLG